MAPKGKELPAGPLMDAIKRDFNSLSGLQEAFSKVAVAHFGSGWAWLVQDPKDNKLKVLSTVNEGNPIQSTRERGILFSGGLKPLLVLDVWEHSYYLDYQFRRAQYVESIVSSIVLMH